MINITPKTFNDVKLLAHCMELRSYIEMDDSEVENLYNYLKNEDGTIVFTKDVILFVDKNGKKKSSIYIGDRKILTSFEKITMTALACVVTNAVVAPNGFRMRNNSGYFSSCSSCSTSSSCSGCGSSGNNNNNNNNNNG